MARRIVFAILPVIAGLLHAPQCRAQPIPQPSPAFEVASVKPGANCDSGGPGGTSPGRLNLSCISLRGLIRMAYSAFAGEAMNARRVDVLGGPAWLDSDKYDLSAKAEDNATPAQMIGPMLQALLEERFKVRVHMEPRDTSVYALTVSKNNPRLQPSKAGSCTPMDLNNLSRTPSRPGEPAPRYCGGGGMRTNGMIWTADWYGVTMAEFAGRMISSYVDRPVIDKTGLSGPFDVHLEFVPDRAMSAGPVRLNGVDSPALSSADAAGPSIFTALQEQLGLRLSADKSPLDTIVVDHAEKPSPN
jgi:uncharacterized protein (TIGR03435 family)